MSAGCTGAMRGRVLHLTLDTPGSSVNVVTTAVAEELQRALKAGLPAGARAVVLHSAKGGSFINSPRLLLAAMTRPDGPGPPPAYPLPRARGWPKRSAASPAASSRLDFDGLPGPERDLAQEYLRLARLPFAPGYRLEEGLGAETSSFWETVGTEAAKHAMAFFFVRQAAKAYAIGSASYERPRRLSLSVAPSSPPLRELRRILSERRLPGIELRRTGTLAFAKGKVAGAFTCAIGGPRAGGDCTALLPFPDGPVPAIEIVPAAAEVLPWRRGAPLFQILEQAGFAPVVTRAKDRFVSERLIAAFHGAVANAPARGALLEFGYRLPASLALKLRPGGSGSLLGERVAVALAAECLRALDEGALAHPSQADLLAHVLFGFPVARGGLLRHAASGGSPVARGAARILGRA